MFAQDFNDLCDVLKGSFPYYLLVFIPIFIIISPVGASHEFPVYRLQHYDLHGIPHGCRKASLNLEARSLTSWSTNRHCVLAQLKDLTSEQFRNIKNKAGGLIAVLPQDMTKPSPELLDLEAEMINEEIQIPIYLTPWTLQLQNILDEVSVQPNDGGRTGLEALLNSVAANGYQMVVPAAQPSPRQDVHIANIQGLLAGQGVQETLPTIAIVAHYDSYGGAPELSFGSDSNASGVTVLIQLARIFSALYGNPRTHGRYNLLFLLSGAGKLNYLGSKKYLEDQIDGLEGSLLQDAAFVLCLDSLSKNSSLHMHVSKPPKENGPSGEFLRTAQTVSNSVRMVHKKINLAEEVLAWEHERYSIRRLPAFTFSSLASHRDLSRSTMFDLRESVDLRTLAGNAAVVAESLARMIYNTSTMGLLMGDLQIEESSLEGMVDLLGTTPRAQQLHSDKNSALVSTLKEAMAKYLQEVKITTFTPDRRDPDIVFYDITSSTLNFYSVKPAVFDLFLTMVIIAYLALIYFFLNSFPDIYEGISKLVSPKKKIN